MTTPSAAAETVSAEGPSRRHRRAGYVLSGLAVLFLIFDLTLKLIASPEALAGTVELGWPASIVRPLGLLQLALLALYLVPRTAVMGAVLWTGYLGGAVATHVRVGNPLFSHQLFPVFVALLLWGGLWLRDAQLRALMPWRR